nr:protein NEDD1 [Tanacetum cinerariifolium]
MVTWTVEYENLSKDVLDSDSLLEFAKNFIKYAETLLNPTLVIKAAHKVGNDIKIPQLQDIMKLFEVSKDPGDPCILTHNLSLGYQVNSIKWNHTNLVVVSDDDNKKISLWQKTGQSTGAFLPSGLITIVTKLRGARIAGEWWWKSWGRCGKLEKEQGREERCCRAWREKQVRGEQYFQNVGERQGISYEEIRPLFEEEYNKVQTLFKEGLEIDAERIKAPRKRTRKENVEKDQTPKKQKGDELEKENAEKQKLEEQQEAEELKRNLEIVPDDEDDVFMNVVPLSSKPPTIINYKIYKEGKKEHFQIIRANGNHQMYLAFSTMLMNFDREDLKVMFEHSVEDSIWKLQKGPKGVARVKNWKLFDSYGVHYVTLDTIQLYLLAEKMYPWTNYTLQQMFKEVRLQVDYEVEMAYDLLRLVTK